MKYVVMVTYLDEIEEDRENEIWGGFKDSYEYEASADFDSLSEANQYAARENFLQSKNDDVNKYFWVKEIE